MPPLLGHAFVLFSSKSLAYRSFFIAAAGLHFVSVTMLLLIDPEGERKRQQADDFAAATGPDSEAFTRSDAGRTKRCCSCGRLGPRLAVVAVTALVGALMTSGLVCAREALVFGIYPSYHAAANRTTANITLFDQAAMRLCGEVTADMGHGEHGHLLPAELQWHHGLILGVLLGGCGLAILFGVGVAVSAHGGDQGRLQAGAAAGGLQAPLTDRSGRPTPVVYETLD